MTLHAQIARQRRVDRTEVAQLLLKGTALIALAVMLVVFGALSPTFLQATNLEIMAKQTAINAILAIGMTFVILTGGIDLSVGSLVGLTAMIAGLLINEGLVLGPLGVILYPHTWMVMVIALVAGAGVGMLNGLIITRFGVAPFIATLGMLYVARGAAGLLNNGNTFPNLVGRPELGNTGFPVLGAGDILGLSYAVWIMAVFALVAWFVTTRTPFGRAVYAVGGNERSAALSGIRVNRTKLVVYMISGFCAATVGLIIASQLVAAHPKTGEFYELNAIAAVVLGGTSLSGGRGTIVGTLIGAFVIGVLTVGLNQLGVSSFWQLIVKGSVIVLALILDQLQVRVQRRIALNQQARSDAAPGHAG
jgi:erythritol transport system permease protein